MSEQLTVDERAYLAMYEADTYAIALPRDIGRELEAKKLVKWVPGPSWGGKSYAITDAGREALARVVPVTITHAE